MKRKIISATLAAALLTAIAGQCVFAEDDIIRGSVYDPDTDEAHLSFEEAVRTLPAGVAKSVKEYEEKYGTEIKSQNFTVEDAIADLSELKIMQGYEDGSIQADKVITRAEMAVLLCRVIYGSNYYHLTKEEALKRDMNLKFSDLPDAHWAFTELCVLSSSDADPIVTGYEDGTVHPDEQITYLEACTLILRTLNYFELIEQKGGYPDGVIYWTEDLKLLRDLNIEDLNTFAARGNIALMLSRALDCPISDTLDSNFYRTNTMQQSPITTRQIRVINDVDNFEYFRVFED